MMSGNYFSKYGVTQYKNNKTPADRMRSECRELRIPGLDVREIREADRSRMEVLLGRVCWRPFWFCCSRMRYRKITHCIENGARRWTVFLVASFVGPLPIIWNTLFILHAFKKWSEFITVSMYKQFKYMNNTTAYMFISWTVMFYGWSIKVLCNSVISAWFVFCVSGRTYCTNQIFHSHLKYSMML
jgi:hypothetical protein